MADTDHERANARELGSLAAELEAVKAQVHEIGADVKALRANVDKGMGIAIGVMAILGLFANELVQWIKHALGVS